jgi:hypothetical protein
MLFHSLKMKEVVLIYWRAHESMNASSGPSQDDIGSL